MRRFAAAANIAPASVTNVGMGELPIMDPR
jgi:hypothetical protein